MIPVTGNVSHTFALMKRLLNPLLLQTHHTTPVVISCSQRGYVSVPFVSLFGGLSVSGHNKSSTNFLNGISLKCRAWKKKQSLKNFEADLPPNPTIHLHFGRIPLAVFR